MDLESKTKLLDVAAARKELLAKSLGDIEHDTALTWGARAAACLDLAKDAIGEERTKWLRDAENYRQEALEHAAMTEDFDFLKQVVKAIASHRS